MSRRLLFSVLTVSLLVSTSCGADPSDQATVDSSSTTDTSTIDTSTTDELTDDSTTIESTATDATPTSGSDTSRLGAPSTTGPPPSTTTTSPASSTTVAPTTEALPGEPADGGPAPGTDVAVVGVRYDAAIELRTVPDATAPVVATAVPLSAIDLDAAGEARVVSGATWWKVYVGGQEAWGDEDHLGVLGQSDDIFNEVGAELVVLTALTVEEMALRVAATRGGAGPQPTMTFVGEPLVFHGVGGFAVIDLIGSDEEQRKGERLRIDVDLAYDENNENVEFVVLSGVERTPICSRGITPQGTCL